MASGELAFAPKPLSVMIQKVPSSIFLMPEWPCSGWPLKGTEIPVGRPAESPSTVPSASVRLPLVNLPLTCRSCGASLGAATKDAAGHHGMAGQGCREDRLGGLGLRKRSAIPFLNPGV